MSSRVMRAPRHVRRGDARDQADEPTEPMPLGPPHSPLMIPVGEAREIDMAEFMREVARAQSQEQPGKR